MSTVSPERLSTPRYCQVCGRFLVERYIERERRRRFQCEACGFIHYMNPRLVSSVVVEHGGRALLQLRADEPMRGFWTFPGGFLEIGETAEEGALRETKEEVGLDVTLTGLLGVYTRPDVGIVLVVYHGRSDTPDAVISDPESLELRWCAPDEIPWSRLASEMTESALRDWVRQQDAGVRP